MSERAELTFSSRLHADRVRAFARGFDRIEEQVAGVVLARHVPIAAAEGVIRAALVSLGRRVASAPLSAAELKAFVLQTVTELESTAPTVTGTPTRLSGTAREAAARATSRRTASLIGAYAVLLNSSSARDANTWLGNWVRTSRTDAALTVDELSPLVALDPRAWRRLERFPLEAATLTPQSLVALIELFRLPFALAAFQLRKGVTMGLPRAARNTGRYDTMHAMVDELLATTRQTLLSAGEVELL